MDRPWPFSGQVLFSGLFLIIMFCRFCVNKIGLQPDNFPVGCVRVNGKWAQLQVNSLVYCKNSEDISEQTVQTQIRLLLKEQSDLGLHCLSFHRHLLDAFLHCKTKLFTSLEQLQQSF